MPESPTGYFRVEQRSGTWWFIPPEGRPEVSLGINHIAPIFMLAPYNREATLKCYGPDFVKETSESGLDTMKESPKEALAAGSREANRQQKPEDWDACSRIGRSFNPDGLAARAWMQQVFADLEDWGFNSLGAHTHLIRHLFRERLPYVQAIDAVQVAFYLGDRKELPDVFSEEFERRVESKTKPIALDCVDDPNLMGYAFGNVPPWTGYEGGHRIFGDYPISPWIDAIRSLPSESAGKKVWMEILRNRYPDATTAARTHGIDATTWDELSHHSQWPIPTEEVPLADTEAFLACIAERWHKVHVEAIRRYDPHHILFGDWLMGNMTIPDFLMPILKEYVDVVVLRWYDYFENQEPTFRKIYEATGKPILSGDSSFSCKRPNQEYARGIECEELEVECGSLEEAGKEYAKYLESAMSQPYMLGWHHCGYIEGWKGLPHWILATQFGFKDPFENVHQETVTHVRRANAQAHEWHKRTES